MRFEGSYYCHHQCHGAGDRGLSQCQIGAHEPWFEGRWTDKARNHRQTLRPGSQSVHPQAQEVIDLHAENARLRKALNVQERLDHDPESVGVADIWSSELAKEAAGLEEKLKAVTLSKENALTELDGWVRRATKAEEEVARHSSCKRDTDLLVEMHKSEVNRVETSLKFSIARSGDLVKERDEARAALNQSIQDHDQAARRLEERTALFDRVFTNTHSDLQAQTQATLTLGADTLILKQALNRWRFVAVTALISTAMATAGLLTYAGLVSL